ncbi:hypothetical protein CRE_09324 [Caenorhabditis remanei]|uniref:Uncharacterized protein n=1 Tax=Caenorhabditis remanei TaxID=31234 RepID=E3LI57_CAERE|nr:hypothetical protein CRE_09324 [Caenorhabditis remanei]
MSGVDVLAQITFPNTENTNRSIFPYLFFFRKLRISIKMSKGLPTAPVKTSTDATITALQEKLSQMEKEYKKLNEQRNAQRDTLIQAFLKKDNELKEMNNKLQEQLKEKVQRIDEENELIKQLKKDYDEKILAQKESFIQKLSEQHQELSDKLVSRKKLKKDYDEKILAQKESFIQKLSEQHQELSDKLVSRKKLKEEYNEKILAEKKYSQKLNQKLKALKLEHQEEIREYQEEIECTERRIEKEYEEKFERFQKYYENALSRASEKPLNKETVDLGSTNDGLDDDDEYFSCCEDFEEDEATTTTGSPAPNSCSNNEDLAEELVQTKKALADLELAMKSHTDWLSSYLDNNSVMISQTFFGNEISRDIEEKIEELEQQIKKSENDRDMADFMAEIQRIEHQREIDNLELRLRDAYTLRDMI